MNEHVPYYYGGMANPGGYWGEVPQEPVPAHQVGQALWDMQFRSKMGALAGSWYERLLGQPLAAIGRIGAGLMGDNQ